MHKLIYILLFAISLFSFSGEKKINGSFKTRGYNHYAPTELTIASGIITKTEGIHSIDGEGDADDNLVTINGGKEGQVLIIYPEDAGRNITIKHGTGNIRTTNAADYLIPDLGMVTLYRKATNWFVISTGSNFSDVTSVFTRTGAVVAAASDYDAGQVDNDSGVAGAFVDDALNTLDTALGGKQTQDDVLDDLSGLSLIQGDTLFFDGSNLNRLPPGIAGQFLKTLGAAANPEWANGGSGTIQLNWKFSTTTTEADPGSKTFRMNNVTPASVTALFISDTSNSNVDASEILNALEAGDKIYIQQLDTSANNILVEIVTVTDNSGWFKLDVTVDDSGTLFGNNKDCGFILIFSAGGGGGGATTALDNLASVAINESLISDTDITDDLGEPDKRWLNIFGQDFKTGQIAANVLTLQAYDVDGTAYVTFATLTANNTPTMVLSGAVTGTTQTPLTTDTTLATTKYVDDAVTAGAGSALPVVDTTSIVEDPGDGTKEMRIDVGNVTTATVRTLFMPDADVILHKDNLTAIIPPTATDDSASGYSVGSTWIDITADESFICVDSTASSAVWNITSTNDTKFSILQKVEQKGDGASTETFSNTSNFIVSSLKGTLTLDDATNEVVVSFAFILDASGDGVNSTADRTMFYQIRKGVTNDVGTVTDGTSIYGPTAGVRVGGTNETSAISSDLHSYPQGFSFIDKTGGTTTPTYTLVVKALTANVTYRYINLNADSSSIIMEELGTTSGSGSGGGGGSGVTREIFNIVKINTTLPTSKFNPFFDTLEKNELSEFATFTNDGTDGLSFTLLKDCNVKVTWWMMGIGSTNQAGITRNASKSVTLGSLLESAVAGERESILVTFFNPGSSGSTDSCSWSGRGFAGDLIMPHVTSTNFQAAGGFYIEFTDDASGGGASTFAVSANMHRLKSRALFIADNASVSTGDIDWSLSMWFKMPEPTTFQGLYCKDEDGQFEFQFVFEPPSNGYRFTLGNGTSGDVAVIIVKGDLAFNEWNHVVFGHDATANEAFIYVNNGDVQTQAESGVPGEGTSSLFIGACNGGSAGAGENFSTAQISRIAFYKKVVTSGEVDTLYDDGTGLEESELSGSLLTSLESTWDCDEESSGQASQTRADSTGSNTLSDKNNTPSRLKGLPQ